MKKTVSASLLAALILFVLCGCSAREQEQKPDTYQTLYDNGIKIISLMTEMADSKDYISAMSVSPELSGAIAQIGGGDYSEPDQVFKVTVPDSISAAAFEAHGEENPDVSDTLRLELDKRFVSSAALRLNSTDGAATVAAVSVLTAGRNFLCEGLDHSMIYLYLFRNGIPIMITFLPGNENIVSASGYFLFSGELDETDEDAVSALLADGAYLPGCEVERLQLG